MKDRSSGEIPFENKPETPGNVSKPPESRTVVIPGDASGRNEAKSRRSTKKSKKRKKADHPNANISSTRVRGPRVVEATTSTKSMAQPNEKRAEKADCASSVGVPIASTDLCAASVALSSSTTLIKTTEYSKGSTSLTQADAQPPPVGNALDDRAPAGAASCSANIDDATGVQARDAAGSSRPSHVFAAGPKNPEPTGSRAHPMAPGGGGSQKLPLGWPPKAVDSTMRDNTPFVAFSGCPSEAISPWSPSGVSIAHAAVEPVVIQVVEQLGPSSSNRQASSRRKASLWRRFIEESEAFDKMREMSLEPHHPAVAVASKTPAYWVACVFLGILFLALVAAGFIGYLATSGHGTKATASEDRFCSISGCLDHANIIGLSDIEDGLHESSPCEDFGRFICSAWAARHERKNVKRRITKTVLTDAAVDYIVSLEKLIGQQHRLAISKRPERMMDVCLMNRPSDDTIVLDQLLDFMNRSGFGFPAENVTESDYSQPLKVLTELAYNWALPLWFYVDLVFTDTAPGRTISLRTAALGDLYAIIHEALMEYEDVYSWYIDTIVAIVYRGSIGLLFHEFTQGSTILQKDVFKNLSWAIRSNNRAPILLQVRSLPYFVEKTTVEHWLEAFGPLWSVDTAISQEDVVYFADRNLLVVMNELFKGYTARDMYLHVHWWFVQILGVVASNYLFESLRKDPERGEFAQKLICSVQVALNYNAIISSEKRAQFNPSARTDITTRLENVRAVALTKVSSTLGTRFGLLLEQVKPVVWLPDRYASEDRLLRLYGPDTNNNATTEEDNFVERWLSRATSYQHSSTFLDERSADASLFRTDSSVLSSHHVMSKTISLSLALLEAPFYYPNATSAIFYGGLGFVYATELVRLINSLSLLLEGRDSIMPSQTAFAQSYVWLPYSCRGLDFREIPRMVALEIAYAAYRDFRMDAEDVRLLNAKSYSPEQVFFATVCYLMCDRDWGAGSCTDTMAHFPQFTTAFSCPPSHARPCNILD